LLPPGTGPALFTRWEILAADRISCRHWIKLVQTALGHGSPTITLNTYVNPRELHQTGEKALVA
jgi:hypothetical protein